jgi:SNF2 family DNA or RNA helicase
VLIEREADEIWITSGYHQREVVKRIPGVKWDRDREQWHVPLSWAACVQSRGVFGDQLEIGPELIAWAETEIATRIGPCIDLRDAEDAELSITLPEGLGLEPRQRAGVAFMATAGSALLGDEMGAGKTVQLICALEQIGEAAYPALVVCPNSMVGTWAAEFGRWAPAREVVVVRGSAKKRAGLITVGADTGAAVYVINYEALRAHSRLAGYGFIKLTDKEKAPKELNAIPFGTVIADEAHRAKSPKTQQTRALWAVGRQATHRFAATGTPLANTPEDLWSVMHFVDPREWPGKTQFVDRYGLLGYNYFGGMNVVGIKGETRDELFKILDPRFIRRPTQIVIPDLLGKLPPQLREIDLLPKQAKAYEQMRKELLAELDGGVLMATNPLTRMVRLLQLCSAYGEVDAEGNMTLAEPSSKLDALDEVLDELFASGEQAVVFAESRQLINLASARLSAREVSHGLITGSVDTAQRDRNVAAFQAGEIPLIMATTSAGGEGLTLTAARHVVFLQRSFSLIRDRQAEARVWRRGQDRPVQRIDIEARDTIESNVRTTLSTKGDILEEVARDQETIRKWLMKI